MSTFLKTFAQVLIAGMQVSAQHNQAQRVQSVEEQYWDGRLQIVLDAIEQYRCMPIRQLGSYRDQHRIERETQERQLKCNELRNKARRACLEKSKWDMDRVESELKTAVFFAS